MLHLCSPLVDKLVDHYLRPVGEVAELRLPDHQASRRGGRVAVLEGEHRLLGEQRIVDIERAPAFQTREL